MGGYCCEAERVALDLDGTLMDGVEAIVAKLRRRFLGSFYEFGDIDDRLLLGASSKEVLDFLQARISAAAYCHLIASWPGICRDFFEELVNTYSNADLNIFEDVTPWLRRFSGSKSRAVIATNRPPDLLVQRDVGFLRAQLGDDLEIRHPGERYSPKPDASMLSGCGVLIGDSLADLLAAGRARIYCVIVLRGRSSELFLGADFDRSLVSFVEDLSEVVIE